MGELTSKAVLEVVLLLHNGHTFMQLLYILHLRTNTYVRVRGWL